MQRTQLTDSYSISRVIKGGWQLAGGHGRIDADQAIADMFAYYDAGVTTFDCADIYTGVEELIGRFLNQLRLERGPNEADKVQVHTKYVPDLRMLGALSADDVENSILRSIRRLGVERLDLVQFHWWDFSVPRYVEVALILDGLRKKGLIRHIGLTNFDPAHIQELKDAGINPISNQVQYSVLDRRPEKSLQMFCTENDMTMLCYGSLAGGFVSDAYLGRPEPSSDDLSKNRSLIKYKLIIGELGGWTEFQKLLNKLHEIGTGRGLTISETAILYVLSKPCVSAVIVGARNDQHIGSVTKMANQSLSADEIKGIDDILHQASLPGDIYQLERTDNKHKGIMKYNLNKERS